MMYNRSSTREKWTIMMYMRDFHLMTTYAYALRTSSHLTDENINEILDKMEKDGVYRPRYGGSTFTGTFKTIQIAWYMFGYYDKSRRSEKTKKMVFSPLGNLLLDNIRDPDKTSKIFMTMLFGNGFKQPFSQMSHHFNIYAFRLVFQLLRDPRLEGRLYHDEVFYLTMFLKAVDEYIYENLVADILALREQNPYTKYELFKKDEHIVGLASHEWRYAAGMLESAGIVQIMNDNDSRIIGRLVYGNGTAMRSYREDYITLRPELSHFVDKLLEKYSCFEKPYIGGDSDPGFSDEYVVKMYSFYPEELLVELGLQTQDDKAITNMLNVATQVNTHATNETENGAERFEFALRDAFRLFMDVQAERVGGAGRTDIECIFFPRTLLGKKFDVEAKSTRTKLPQVNSRRLRTHRELVKSHYTIVIAPDFARGVLDDISGEDTVIIRSATFANYLYQYIAKYGRDISYHDLDKIVAKNTGKDITGAVNDFVFSNFGHSYSPEISTRARPYR